MLKIFGKRTAEEVGSAAADIITAVVNNKPDAVLALATGSSPLSLYGELAKRCRDGKVSFKNVKTVNLDEYVGLAPDHPQSYAYFMNKNLFSLIDIEKKNTHLPNGLATCPECECMRYDGVVAAMDGIDVQVLGIGNNGHIGFNEPSDAFSVGSVVVDLTDSTIDANSRFFESRDQVPTKAISMGIGQIMSSKKIIMIALGKGKAQILEEALFGPVSPKNPASIIRFASDVSVIADTDALSLIMEKHPGAVLL